MTERWFTHEGRDYAPVEAYDRVWEQLDRAERLLAEIRDGKHSLPGTIVQIERYFAERGKDVTRDERVEQAIALWHEAPPGRYNELLHEYLGWTWEEYCHYVETTELPPERKGAK